MLENDIVVTSTPAVVNVNFEQLVAAVTEELEKYDLIVTADTVADAKKLATDINKMKGLIDQRRKHEVKKASAPIAVFDEQMKELVIMYEQARKKILDQVKRFEDEIKQKIHGLLLDYQLGLWEKYAIREQYVKNCYEDLIILSAITEGGKLKKSVRDTLEGRIRDIRAYQDHIDRRLLELENQCYKAGLQTPLTAEHVQGFLQSEESVYQDQLSNLIAIEIDRQDKAEQKLRSQISKEAPSPAPEPVAEPAANPKPEPAPTAKPVTVEAGNVAYSVQCLFSVEVPDSVTTQQLEDELKRVMKAAGIEALDSVTITKQQQAA